MEELENIPESPECWQGHENLIICHDYLTKFGRKIVAYNRNLISPYYYDFQRKLWCDDSNEYKDCGFCGAKGSITLCERGKDVCRDAIEPWRLFLVCNECKSFYNYLNDTYCASYGFDLTFDSIIDDDMIYHLTTLFGALPDNMPYLCSHFKSNQDVFNINYFKRILKYIPYNNLENPDYSLVDEIAKDVMVAYFMTDEDMYKIMHPYANHSDWMFHSRFSFEANLYKEISFKYLKYIASNEDLFYFIIICTSLLEAHFCDKPEQSNYKIALYIFIVSLGHVVYPIISQLLAGSYIGLSINLKEDFCVDKILWLRHIFSSPYSKIRCFLKFHRKQWIMVFRLK